MPPRLPRIHSLRTIRLPPPIRRPLSTSTANHRVPPSTSRSVPVSMVLIGGGLAFYLFSHPSSAETQSSKTSSANENREATAGQSRKAAEKPGKAEKEANKSGGSSQDNKPELAVDSKKPEKDADKDSKTGKIKGGHDENGQPKDEKVKEKAGGNKDVGKKDDGKKDGGNKNEGKGHEKSGSEAEEGHEDENDEDAGVQAFDPETGEINWDCPCLGDLPHGVCGPQFRKAFECFIHSQAEEKGSDCVPAFAEMQDCFRAHPDVYKPMDALDDDDDDLDPTSTEALETATKEGDKELDQKKTGKAKEEKEGGGSKKHEEGEKVSLEHQGGKKPKQGDERKNEKAVARSG